VLAFVLNYMMKKLFISAAICLGIVLSLWIVARITGMLQFYSIPTVANEPTIKKGDKVFTTNLKEAKPYEFIAFTSKYEDSVLAQYSEGYKRGSHYLYRLCGIGGNTLEMKNGVLYVDGKNFDEDLNLKYSFQIGTKAFNELIEEADKNEEENYRPSGTTQDSIIIMFDRLQVKKYRLQLKLTPFIMSDTINGPFKWLDINSTWTADNFGPLHIPAACYFALGDNRHNAMDSRYTGFIKAHDIKGVVLNK